MKFLANQLKRFRKEEDGAALVEYGVTLLVVILVGATAIVTIGKSTGSLFGTAATTASTVCGNISGATCN